MTSPNPLGNYTNLNEVVVPMAAAQVPVNQKENEARAPNQPANTSRDEHSRQSRGHEQAEALLSVPLAVGKGLINRRKSSLQMLAEEKLVQSTIGAARGGPLADDEQNIDEVDLLAVAYTNKPLTAMVTDIFDDYNDVFNEGLKSLSTWRRVKLWILKKALPITITTLSLVVTMTLWIVEPGIDLNNDKSAAWVWTALPGLLMSLGLLAKLAENAVLQTAYLFMTSPTWLFPLVQSAVSGYLRIILFGLGMDYGILPWWTRSGGIQFQLLPTLNKLVEGLYAVAVCLSFRNILQELFQMWAATNAFHKRISALVFLEDSLHQLCCRNAADEKSLGRIRYETSSNRHIMWHISNITSGCLSFPVAHNVSSGEWEFSTASRIDVKSEGDMTIMSDIVFNNIIDDYPLDNPSDTNSMKMSTFEKRFPTQEAGNQAFTMMFYRQGRAVQLGEVTREQFAAAFSSIYATRGVLSNRLNGFQNLVNLISTISSIAFYVIVILITLQIFGYQLGQLVTAISAIILSVSFALSMTISRTVECIVFIFGNKPFQVNDSVVIDGNWYCVIHIGILETKLRDRVNKTVRMSNKMLIDLPITNLTNSGTIVTRIVNDIALDTPVESLDRLKASIVKYCVNHSESWEPRASLFLNDMSRSNSIEIEIRVNSVFRYVDGGRWRAPDTHLKTHIRTKMTKLGIRWVEPMKPLSVKLSEAGAPKPPQVPVHKAHQT